MLDGVNDQHEAILLLLLAGGVALALLNLGTLARKLRLHKLVLWIGGAMGAMILAIAERSLSTVLERSVGPVLDRLDRVESQVTSANSGSLREAVNEIRSDVKSARRSLEEFEHSFDMHVLDEASRYRGLEARALRVERDLLGQSHNPTLFSMGDATGREQQELD